MRIVYIDYDRSTCLCDVGLPGWAAVIAITDDGDEHFVVLSERPEADRVGYNPDTPQAPHEQPGPLPLDVVRRITAARRRGPPLRCGRPTKTTGQPCRIEVTRPGEPCGLHRTEAHR